MRVSNFKLGIGLPLSFHFVPVEFFESFLAMDKPPFVYIRPTRGSTEGPAVEAMRNSIVLDAMEAGCSHLLMLDTDQVYHRLTVTRLLAHRLPVVGALVYRRYPPFDPLMSRGDIGRYVTIETWQPNSLVEVDATGTGCLLFDLQVFRRMPRPWFKTWQHNGRPVGEDFHFCAELRRAGYQLFVDTSVPAGHLSQMQITEGTWRLYRRLKEAERAATMHEPAPSGNAA